MPDTYLPRLLIAIGLFFLVANVRLLASHSLQGLLGEPGAGRISGVVVKPSGPDATPFNLHAELVVASGRSGAALRGLEGLGYATPDEESIGVDIGYATRVSRQPDDGRDWKCMAVYTTAPRTHRLGVVFSIEGDRWIVTLVGLRGHYPRNDDDATFLEFAASLEQPDLYEAISAAEPDGPVRLIGYANQMRRRFERLKDLAGLLFLGDSICSLNPLYGQGMTLCALQAAILDRCLERRRGSAPDAALARDYFREVASVVDTAWLLGAGSDFLYPETRGPRPPYAPLLGWYITRLLRLSGSSEVVQMRLGPPAPPFPLEPGASPWTSASRSTPPPGSATSRSTARARPCCSTRSRTRAPPSPRARRAGPARPAPAGPQHHRAAAPAHLRELLGQDQQHREVRLPDRPAGPQRDALLPPGARAHRRDDANRLHARGGRGVPEVLAHLPAGPRPVHRLRAARPHRAHPSRVRHREPFGHRRALRRRGRRRRRGRFDVSAR